MFRFIGLCLGTLVRLLRARRSLLLENLALRQQLAALKRRHPRPRLDLLDKLFWVAVRRFWSGWQQSLIAVTPETVVRWHRGGFRLYWKLISKVKRPAEDDGRRWRFRNWYSGWSLRTQRGERRASMASFSCSVLMSLSERSLVGLNGHLESRSQLSAGLPFSEDGGNRVGRYQKRKCRNGLLRQRFHAWTRPKGCSIAGKASTLRFYRKKQNRWQRTSSCPHHFVAHHLRLSPRFAEVPVRFEPESPVIRQPSACRAVVETHKSLASSTSQDIQSVTQRTEKQSALPGGQLDAIGAVQGRFAIWRISPQAPGSE